MSIDTNKQLRKAILLFDLARAITGKDYVLKKINDDEADNRLENDIATLMQVIKAYADERVVEELQALIDGDNQAKESV